MIDTHIRRLALKGAYAILTTVLFTLCLQQNVYLIDGKVRLRLSDTPLAPSEKGVIVLDHAVPPELARDGTLLALQITNGNTSPLNLRLDIGGSFLQFVVPPAAKTVRRIPIPKELLAQRTSIRLRGTGDWTLARAELRNYIGFTSHYFGAVLCSSNYTNESKLDTRWIIFFAAVVFGLSWVRGNTMSLRAKPYRFFANLAPVLLLAMMVTPLVSHSRILVSAISFFKILTFYYLPSIAAIYQACGSWEKKHGLEGQRDAILTASGAFLFYFLLLQFQAAQHDGNLSAFLNLGARFTKQNALLDETPGLRDELVVRKGVGYDGQFFFFIAQDPFATKFQNEIRDYRTFLDIPTYRYRRILFALLSRAACFGNFHRLPAAMLGLILLGIAFTAYSLARLAFHFSTSAWWGLLAAAVPGFAVALLSATPEPVAAAFALAGCYSYFKNRTVFASIFLALALLTRETSVLILITFVGLSLLRKQIREAVVLSLGFLPYLFWRIFVTLQFRDLQGYESFFKQPGSFTFPLTGMLTAISFSDNTARVSVSALAVLLLLTFAVCLYLWKKRPGALPFVAAAYSFLALCLNYNYVWHAAENVERTMFEATVLTGPALLWVLASSRNRIPVWVYAGCLFVYCLFFMSHHPAFAYPFQWLLEMNG